MFDMFSFVGGGFFDSYYLILVLPALIFSIYAQFKVKSTFNKFSEQFNRRGISGAQAARLILDRNGLRDVAIEMTYGTLSDHYDPRSKVLRLSEAVHGSSSIAAVGVAAHEAGHALQHATGYAPLMLRSGLVPIANIGSSVGPYLALFGLLFSFPLLLQIGIWLFAAAVAFYFITLPVEFNASSRAIEVLQSQNVLSVDEIGPARKVLNAAAMTYVASALVALGSLVRLILISRGSNNRDE